MNIKVALIVIALVLSSVLAGFVIFMQQQSIDILEEVPGSYGALINTGYKDQFRNGYPGSYIAIQFIIPAGKNVLTDAFVYFGGGQWDVIHEVGFSRSLTTNSGAWATYSTFKSAFPYGDPGVQIIKNARLQTTGGIVRCNPGEVWYLIIKVNSGQPQGMNVWFTIQASSTGFPDNTSIYICNSGESTFVGQGTYDGCLRIYGYKDELFYVNFDYTPKNPTVNQVITFTDTSNQNLIESRQWLIDNTVKYGSTITYSFSSVGQYPVSLIGVSYGGSNLQTTKIIEVGSTSPPPPTNHAPESPSNPNPPTGKIDVVPPSVTLSWSCYDTDGDTIRYDVYFGTSSSPPIKMQGITNQQYSVSSLNDNTAYYWQIYAFDGELGKYGPVWTFSTGSANHPPNIPSNPDPINGQTEVSDSSITLYWDGGDPDGDTVTYDVYFGTDTVPSALVATQQSTHWKTPDLDSSTNYYWKVNAKDTSDVYSYGPTWYFTTKGEITPPPPTNQPPEIIDDSGDLNLIAGKIVTLWVKATDDHGVSSALIEIDGVQMGQMSYDPLEARWEYTYTAPESGASQTTYAVTVYDESQLSDSISRYIFIDFSQHSTLLDQIKQLAMEYWQYILIGLAVLVLIILLARRRG